MMISQSDLDAWDYETVLALKNPQYKKNPLCMIGANITTDNVFNACHTGWSADHTGEEEWRVLLFKEVILAAEGLILNKNLSVLHSSVTQHSEAEIETALSKVDRKNIPYINESCLLLKKRGCLNYGHWLIEILPKLALLNGSSAFSQLILPSASGSIADVIEDSVTMIAGDLYRRLNVGSDPIKVRELIVVEGLTAHGVHMSPLALTAAKQMRNFAKGGGPKKIFVSRQSAQTRRISNFDEISNLLASKGFILVDPSTLSLPQQINLFHDAEFIIGTMGAAMTNIALTSSPAIVINIAPFNMPDTFFYLLSCHMKHSYIEFRCAVEGDQTSWDSDIYVDMHHLERLLDMTVAVDNFKR